LEKIGCVAISVKPLFFKYVLYSCVVWIKWLIVVIKFINNLFSRYYIALGEKYEK